MKWEDYDDNTRLRLTIATLVAALKLTKREAGLSPAQTQLIDSAINLAHEETHAEADAP